MTAPALEVVVPVIPRVTYGVLDEIPTRPMPSTIREGVVVPLSATTNTGAVAVTILEYSTENCPQGVVDAIPDNPADELMVVVAEQVPRLRSPPFIDASPANVALPVTLSVPPVSILVLIVVAADTVRKTNNNVKPNDAIRVRAFPFISL